MTVTRFAPSPTGYLHIGNLRTALFNYLIARKNGGEFILRLDDTDPTRSRKEYVDQIKTDLDWLGLHWDRVETQSSRLDRYRRAADDLRKQARFYEAFETPTELDLKRKKQLNMGKPPVYDRSALRLSADEREKLRAERGTGVWRFKLDQTRIEWGDGILGAQSIDAASVSDPVLIRADGQFLYTLASVCDDIDYGVTHVVRGSDHVTNTAIQIQIIQALGAEPPKFAHHSLLTGPEGEPLSKRLGALALKDLRAEGIEPMAILTHLANLGSAQAIGPTLSLDDLAESFQFENFSNTPSKFNKADLYPLTSRLLSALDLMDVKDALVELQIPEDQQAPFWNTVKGNLKTRDDIALWWEICKNGADPQIDQEDQSFINEAKAHLPSPPWDENTWKNWSDDVKKATGRKGKDLFMPLRKALTGRGDGPNMAELMPLIARINF